MNEKKKGLGLLAKQSISGWIWLLPGAILIGVMSFYPMVRAFVMSLKTGSSAAMVLNQPLFNNYVRMSRTSCLYAPSGIRSFIWQSRSRLC